MFPHATRGEGGEIIRTKDYSILLIDLHSEMFTQLHQFKYTITVQMRIKPHLHIFALKNSRQITYNH